MTIILICAIPVTALFGLFMYALCAAASEADRWEEEHWTEWQQEQKERDS